MQIVHMEDIAARRPKFMLPTHPLSDSVKAALAARNVSQLFTHQAQAIDQVMAGHNVVVSTSTASGKSLCYNIPILEALVQDRRTCALYMFPTKVILCCTLRSQFGRSLYHQTPVLETSVTIAKHVGGMSSIR